jgi:adenylosuccinate synthase
MGVGIDGIGAEGLENIEKQQLRFKGLHWAQQIKRLAEQKIPDGLKQYKNTITYEITDTPESIELKVKCHSSISNYVKEAFDELKAGIPQDIRSLLEKAISNLQ